MTEKNFDKLSSVDIRPGVSVLAILRHLNYKPWYALGEFVDNSVQSYFSNLEALKKIHGQNFKLRVDIDIDSTAPGSISIKDNAGGINRKNYIRAFRPAAIPPDRTGLSEFGMGMKSAACWFASRWKVRTTAIDESIERVIEFDISQIVNDDISELEITEKVSSDQSHFTEIVLLDLHHLPSAGRTLGKIKEHLTDIYRIFTRDNILDLRLNGESLEFKEPKILFAPNYKIPYGPNILWRKNIEFNFGDDLKISGFAALRETGSTSKAGFALFRRGRLIQGSGDEGYRPQQIFGSSNSYRYQRLFGELHLDGFEVTHTKDGFRWDENEQPFLELLKEHLNSNELPLLLQAEEYRVKSSFKQVKSVASTAVINTVQALEGGLEETMSEIDAFPLAPDPLLEMEAVSASLAKKEFEVSFREQNWAITIELTNDEAESDWIVISDKPAMSGFATRKLDLRISLAHPFMIRFGGTDAEDIEALLRVGTAIGLAEVLASEAGVHKAGTFRRNINEIIRDVLSHI